MKKRWKKLPNKVNALFREAGLDTSRLAGDRFPKEICELIAESLQPEIKKDLARDIAFHLVDWNADAAFLIALLIWPDRFTREEISQGVYQFMPHVSDHLAAAAKLFGTPVTDVFGVGALDVEEEK